ncbi:unnamed protein product [Amoebophrya sp. A120]|nr:unnamed protein product [Amoebophrya sp. A120]|eukprot:GSA120T00005895001.1
MKAAFSCCCSGKESLKLNEQKLSPIHQDEADKYSIFGKKYVTSGAKNSVLKVKQKFWSMTGNDYDVMDMNDDKEEKIAFKVKGEKWSLRKQKKKIFDSDGKPVFSIFGTGWFHHKQAVKKLDAKEEEGEQDICTINSNCPNTVQYTEDGISGKNKFYLKYIQCERAAPSPKSTWAFFYTKNSPLLVVAHDYKFGLKASWCLASCVAAPEKIDRVIRNHLACEKNLQPTKIRILKMLIMVRLHMRSAVVFLADLHKTSLGRC